jgi:hypothetical protein
LRITRNTDNDTFEKIAQPTPCLPIPMSSQLLSSSHSSSCYVSPGPETTSVPDSDISTAGINPKHWHWHPAHTSTVYNYVYHDRRRDDYRYGWELSAPARGYRDDTHVAGYPLGHPPPRPRDGTLDEPLPRIRAYGTIYTDDTRMRLGDRIRRQCFNCQATKTTTWRHSTLSPGKLVCHTFSSG